MRVCLWIFTHMITSPVVWTIPNYPILAKRTLPNFRVIQILKNMPVTNTGDLCGLYCIEVITPTWKPGKVSF